jgi:hypothetical protein
MWEGLNGPIHYENKQLEDGTWSDKSVYTFGFVKSMVGYGTNVSNEALGTWSKRVLGREVERFQQQFEKSLAEPAEPETASMPS